MHKPARLSTENLLSFSLPACGADNAASTAWRATDGFLIGRAIGGGIDSSETRVGGGVEGRTPK